MKENKKIDLKKLKRECAELADEVFNNVFPPVDNQATNEKELSLCPTCGCMTKTIQTKCGKCGITKDNQGDWEVLETLIRNAIKNQLYWKTCNPKYKTDYNPEIGLGVEVEICVSSVKDFIRELLKRQKEEIVVKAEGYRNTYDALGKFIEDLSNS